MYMKNFAKLFPIDYTSVPPYKSGDFDHLFAVVTHVCELVKGSVQGNVQCRGTADARSRRSLTVRDHVQAGFRLVKPDQLDE